MTDIEALIVEARVHRVTTGPNMGICAADGVLDSPIGRVLRDECDLVQHLAPALEQSRPRVVETVEELDALPVLSVIREAHGYTLERLSDGWFRAGVPGGYPLGNKTMLPATVLYTPEEATR